MAWWQHYKANRPSPNMFSSKINSGRATLMRFELWAGKGLFLLLNIFQHRGKDCVLVLYVPICAKQICLPNTAGKTSMENVSSTLIHFLIRIRKLTNCVFTLPFSDTFQLVNEIRTRIVPDVISISHIPEWRKRKERKNNHFHSQKSVAVTRLCSLYSLSHPEVSRSLHVTHHLIIAYYLICLFQ